ncbi:MAG: CTP synthase, partial [bacterium]|nr:CTP synthase [bacterium]
AAAAYGQAAITERHRHRYEFNNKYRELLAARGLRFSGLHRVSETQQLVEMIELPVSVHPWFLGTQAHPEFKSRPTKPAPLYNEFVRAAIAYAGVETSELERRRRRSSIA